MCVLKYSLAAGTQVEDELHGHDQDVEALLGDDDKPLKVSSVQCLLVDAKGEGQSMALY